MKDPKTKRSRGFGFITYSRSFMVDKAQAARPHRVDGRVVEPKRAVPRQDIHRPEAGASVKKLFVGGIKDEHEDDDLRQYFSKFGNVTTVNIVNDKDNGKRRGFAFVEFDDYDPVDKVVCEYFFQNYYIQLGECWTILLMGSQFQLLRICLKVSYGVYDCESNLFVLMFIFVVRPPMSNRRSNILTTFQSFRFVLQMYCNVG